MELREAGGCGKTGFRKNTGTGTERVLCGVRNPVGKNRKSGSGVYYRNIGVSVG